MTWEEFKFKITDMWRRWRYDPVLYCLYEKTRKRQIEWEGIYRVEDGGVKFNIDWSNAYEKLCIIGLDIKTNERVYFRTGADVDSLQKLVRRVKREQELDHNNTRIQEYLKENC